MVTMNGNEDSSAVLPAAAPSIEQSLDDDDDGMSEDSSPNFEDSNELMNATMDDEVTAQLAAAGPIGLAAAAAIASAKKRKRPHQFETNPSIRKRQQTRLLRKLRQTIDEFTIRVGMQAVVLVTIPGKPQNSYKCFGAKPLEDVIRNLRPTVMNDLENALAVLFAHAPVQPPVNSDLHELPPLVIDGIPTPVEKMTQAQLRAFIPLMLKYSTGRGKPGWGKESTRPPWWPSDLPWANVRMDARTEDEKQKVSWTHALRQIVINCYKYHGREDLLPVFSPDSEEQQQDVKPTIVKMPKSSSSHNTSNTTQANPITVSVSNSVQSITQSIPQQTQVTLPQEKQMYQICEFLKPGSQEKYGVYGTSFTPTVLQTISNPDGTVSIVTVDPTNSIITLPDGTTAQVQGVATLQHSNDGSGPTVQNIQTLAEITGHGHHEGVELTQMDLSHLHQSMGQEGQIILTGEDGSQYPVTVSGIMGVPHNMYQSVVANISHLQAQNDGTLQTRYIVQSHKKKTAPKKRFKMHSNAIANSKSRAASVITFDPNNIKMEPGTEGESIQDQSQTQILQVNANGEVVHNNKIYQICEFLKPEMQQDQQQLEPKIEAQHHTERRDSDSSHHSHQMVIEEEDVADNSQQQQQQQQQQEHEQSNQQERENESMEHDGNNGEDQKQQENQQNTSPGNQKNEENVSES